MTAGLNFHTRAGRLMSLLLALFVFGSTQWVHAADELRSYDIPSQPLGAALNQLAVATGKQIIVPSELVKGNVTAALRGRFTTEEALARLLSGTGLIAKPNPEGVYVVQPGKAEAANGTRMLGPVRVEGAGSADRPLSGTNGSRDRTATEGTHSYTSDALTVGSKAPQAMKDTIQSVSVLTAQRMADQNITDFTQAMSQLPGVTMTQGSNVQQNYYSRGFALTSIQIDGGAPLFSGSFEPGLNRYYTQIDMSQFDHVELLRGADSLNLYGSPSGSVNLVRKRPLDHGQVTLESQAGSWNMRRVVLDATKPLALDGDLRGRAVMTYQSNDHFYDVAKDNKTLLYGILEYDLTPSTVVSGGVSYTKQHSIPWYYALPRYEDGTDLKLPRSTCLCATWSIWDFETTDTFLQLEQKVGQNWRLRLNLTQDDQDSTRKLGTVSGPVNPITKAGPTFSGGRLVDMVSHQRSAEMTLSGSFDVLGQRQVVLMGASYEKYDTAGTAIYDTTITGTYAPYPGGPIGPVPVNVFNFNPYDQNYKEPPNGLLTSIDGPANNVQSGAYANVVLTAFDRLHFGTGVRFSRYQHEYGGINYCTNTTGVCAGKKIGDPQAPVNSQPWHGNDWSWPPTVSLSYDVTKALTAYTSYTDIYVSQATSLDRDLNPLAPVTGSNIEAGVKWAPGEGRLNASLAAYRIEQKGFSMTDIGAQTRVNGITYAVDSKGNLYQNGTIGNGPLRCCYVQNPNQTALSQGLDAELTGEVLPGWQVSASYTFNKNERTGSSFGTSEGQPLVTLQPKSLYKLWTSYSFSAPGALNGLTLSAGINGQSDAYYSGTACTVFNAPDPVTGAITCKTSVPYRYSQKAYAVGSARIDYRVGSAWTLGLLVNNITDLWYYQTPGSSSTGNWYGEPRSYSLTVRGKF
ncbi:MAG: TonB-dependent receptor [Gammaproteobacteria bacterium]